MSNPDYQSTLDCKRKLCEGDVYVLLDGTITCKECDFTEPLWCDVPEGASFDNAVEFQGYAENVIEYIHYDFYEWYVEYVKLVDLYYKLTRGWPSVELKKKFYDMSILMPIKILQFLLTDYKNTIRQAARDVVEIQTKEV